MFVDFATKIIVQVAGSIFRLQGKVESSRLQK
jgi:hypothetical protein